MARWTDLPGHRQHDGRLLPARRRARRHHHRHLDGYQARAEPTGASVDNVVRIANGDMDIGFSLADTAADGYEGAGLLHRTPTAGAGDRPHLPQLHPRDRAQGGRHQLLRRPARQARLHRIGELRHRRDRRPVAHRRRDRPGRRHHPAAALPAGDGQADAGRRGGRLFWSGGLPTPGITDLFAAAGDTVTFLPIADLTERLNQRFGPVYIGGGAAAQRDTARRGTCRRWRWRT